MPKAQTTTKTSTQPNTMTGLAGWVEVFRAGDHVASNGKAISFSQADLDQMIVNHKLGSAPAVIGHPKKTARAWAWVDEYKRDGDVLFAKFTDIDPVFEAGVKSKAYRNRSLSVWPDPKHGWRVRHVGWLGAEPPAIDGLADVNFSGDEADALEFSAPGYSLVWGVESIVRLLRGLRDQLVAKDGIEAADAVLPQWQIDSAMDAVNQARVQYQQDDEGVRNFSQPNPGDSMTTFTQAQLDAAKELGRKEAEDKAKLEFSAKEEQLVKLQAERQAERIKTQIEGWKGAGLVTPAEEPGLAEFMTALEDQTTVEFDFSAHDGKPAKKTPTQFFAEFMASRAPIVKLNHRSTPEGDGGTGGDVVDFSQQPGYAGVKVDSDRAAQDARIKDYAKKNGVDYATAASRVLSS